MKTRIFSVILLIGIVASIFAIGASAYDVLANTPAWVLGKTRNSTKLGYQLWEYRFDSYTNPPTRAKDPINIVGEEYVNWAALTCVVDQGSGDNDWENYHWVEAFSTSGLSYNPNAAVATNGSMITDDINTDDGIGQ